MLLMNPSMSRSSSRCHSSESPSCSGSSLTFCVLCLSRYGLDWSGVVAGRLLSGSDDGVSLLSVTVTIARGHPRVFLCMCCCISPFSPSLPLSVPSVNMIDPAKSADFCSPPRRSPASLLNLFMFLVGCFVVLFNHRSVLAQVVCMWDIEAGSSSQLDPTIRIPNAHGGEVVEVSTLSQSCVRTCNNGFGSLTGRSWWLDFFSFELHNRTLPGTVTTKLSLLQLVMTSD